MEIIWMFSPKGEFMLLNMIIFCNNEMCNYHHVSTDKWDKCEVNIHKIIWRADFMFLVSHRRSSMKWIHNGSTYILNSSSG